MRIRREVPSDIPTVQDIVAAAFATPEGTAPIEAGLLAQLRECEGWIPNLSVVAIGDDGDLIGHIVATRGWVEDLPVLGVGPVSVRPDRQRLGVGSAMMHYLLGAADALGESLMVLLGEPAYYSRFGYRPGAEHGIRSPDDSWGAYFQVLPLAAYEPRMKGLFRYAEPFTKL